ncbi:DUF1049 domain-containing protein [Streptomyces sp. NPDC001514]
MTPKDASTGGTAGGKGGSKGGGTRSGSATSGGARGGGLGGRFTLARIAFLVLAALTLIFIFENTRRVKVRLLVPEVVMPLYLGLLGATLLGVLCGAYLFRRRGK